MTNVIQQFFAECFTLNVCILEMKYDDFNHLVVDGLILYQELLTNFYRLPSSFSGSTWVPWTGRSSQLSTSSTRTLNGCDLTIQEQH